MKPLTLEETRLKEEMKARCLSKGQYKDENAKAKFKMLCHLEDFAIQYWELKEENDTLKKRIKDAIAYNQMINDSDYVYLQDEITTKNLDILKEISE